MHTYRLIFNPPPSHPFCLLVMGIPPHLLEFLMELLREFMALEDGIQLFEVTLNFAKQINFIKSKKIS